MGSLLSPAVDNFYMKKSASSAPICSEEIVMLEIISSVELQWRGALKHSSTYQWNTPQYPVYNREGRGWTINLLKYAGNEERHMGMFKCRVKQFS